MTRKRKAPAPVVVRLPNIRPLTDDEQGTLPDFQSQDDIEEVGVMVLDAFMLRDPKRLRAAMRRAAEITRDSLLLLATFEEG